MNGWIRSTAHGGLSACQASRPAGCQHHLVPSLPEPVSEAGTAAPGLGYGAGTKGAGRRGPRPGSPSWRAEESISSSTALRHTRVSGNKNSLRGLVTVLIVLGFMHTSLRAALSFFFFLISFGSKRCHRPSTK